MQHLSSGRRIARYFLTIIVSTLIAEAVLLPPVLYHFNRMAAYGVVANLFAMPATALWVMPAAVLAMVAMPFGLERLPLAAMGEGIGFVVLVARLVSGAPGAELPVPAFSTVAYVTFMLAVLTFCLLKGRGRLFALPIALFGLMLASSNPRPYLLVDGKAQVMAVRAPDGLYWFSPGRAGKHARRVAASQNGQKEEPRWQWTERQYRVNATYWLHCDAIGCLYTPPAHPGKRVALVYDPVAALEDCLRVDAVVAFERLGAVCRGASLVIDWAAIRANGGHALFLSEKGEWEIRTVRAERGKRPWVR